jgi:DNA-binding NtrC family response regulator
VPEAITSEQPRANLSTSLRGTETVLLVEDEDDLRTLTRNLLERSGYTVLIAKDGNEALQVSQQYKTTIHLLLTDVVMPGMSGPVLAQQLTRQRPEIKTVYMSGYTGKTVAGHSVLDPDSFFLMKPFTRDSLASKIREALDSLPAAATK